MRHIEPVNYNIHLKPDLANFTFSGKCEILFEASEPTPEVALNILQIAVWSCAVLEEDRLQQCRFAVDPAKEELSVLLPRPMSGKIRLNVEYQGLINDDMAGFYRSR